jgi:hypothetical protein
MVEDSPVETNYDDFFSSGMNFVPCEEVTMPEPPEIAHPDHIDEVFGFDDFERLVRLAREARHSPHSPGIRGFPAMVVPVVLDDEDEADADLERTQPVLPEDIFGQNVLAHVILVDEH